MEERFFVNFPMGYLRESETQKDIPVGTEFVTLDIDGYELSSDWYLRLTGKASEMLRGEMPLTSEIPK